MASTNLPAVSLTIDRKTHVAQVVFLTEKGQKALLSGNADEIEVVDLMVRSQIDLDYATHLLKIKKVAYLITTRVEGPSEGSFAASEGDAIGLQLHHSLNRHTEKIRKVRFLFCSDLRTLLISHVFVLRTVNNTPLEIKPFSDEDYDRSFQNMIPAFQEALRMHAALAAAPPLTFIEMGKNFVAYPVFLTEKSLQQLSSAHSEFAEVGEINIHSDADVQRIAQLWKENRIATLLLLTSYDTRTNSIPNAKTPVFELRLHESLVIKAITNKIKSINLARFSSPRDSSARSYDLHPTYKKNPLVVKPLSNIDFCYADFSLKCEQMWNNFKAKIMYQGVESFVTKKDKERLNGDLGAIAYFTNDFVLDPPKTQAAPPPAAADIRPKEVYPSCSPSSSSLSSHETSSIFSAPPNRPPPPIPSPKLIVPKPIALSEKEQKKANKKAIAKLEDCLNIKLALKYSTRISPAQKKQLIAVETELRDEMRSIESTHCVSSWVNKIPGEIKADEEVQRVRGELRAKPHEKLFELADDPNSFKGQVISSMLARNILLMNLFNDLEKKEKAGEGIYIKIGISRTGCQQIAVKSHCLQYEDWLILKDILQWVWNYKATNQDPLQGEIHSSNSERTIGSGRLNHEFPATSWERSFFDNSKLLEINNRELERSRKGLDQQVSSLLPAEVRPKKETNPEVGKVVSLQTSVAKGALSTAKSPTLPPEQQIIYNELLKKPIEEIQVLADHLNSFGRKDDPTTLPNILARKIVLQKIFDNVEQMLKVEPKIYTLVGIRQPDLLNITAKCQYLKHEDWVRMKAIQERVLKYKKELADKISPQPVDDKEHSTSKGTYVVTEDTLAVIIRIQEEVVTLQDKKIKIQQQGLLNPSQKSLELKIIETELSVKRTELAAKRAELDAPKPAPPGRSSSESLSSPGLSQATMRPSSLDQNPSAIIPGKESSLEKEYEWEENRLISGRVTTRQVEVNNSRTDIATPHLFSSEKKPGQATGSNEKAPFKEKNFDAQLVKKAEIAARRAANEAEKERIRIDRAKLNEQRGQGGGPS